MGHHGWLDGAGLGSAMCVLLRHGGGEQRDGATHAGAGTQNSFSFSLGLPSCLQLYFPLMLSYFIKAG